MDSDENRPLIDEVSAGYLVGVINRAVESFDFAELTNNEALAACIVLDRLMGRLWSAHQHVLLPVYLAALARRRPSEDDEPEGNGGDLH